MKRIIGLVFALLFVTFAFSQTKTEIKPADLSKGVSTYISTNFPGYAVEKIFKVDNKGVMSTEVKISKGAERLALTFDKDFKLTKKEAIKPDVKATPAKEDRKQLSPLKK